MSLEDEGDLITAYMLGWRIALMTHGLDPSNANFGAGQPTLREIALGQLTVVANPEEAARDLGEIAEALGGRDNIADANRFHMPGEMAADREIARRILSALGERLA